MPRPSLLPKFYDACIEICGRIAEGETLREIYNDREKRGYPEKRVFYHYLFGKHEDPEVEKMSKHLRVLYAEARESSGLVHGDRVAEVAKMVLEGQIDPNAGRVAMDGFKWIAGNRNQKHYGQRRYNVLEGPDGAPAFSVQITQAESKLC
jgi:hypothetical protein